MAYNKVPEWPAHKRPDMDRDKYGPLPNPNPFKKAKSKYSGKGPLPA